MFRNHYFAEYFQPQPTRPPRLVSLISLIGRAPRNIRKGTFDVNPELGI